MSARVLVVDDTPANVKMLRDVLNSAGYKVAAASNGEDALAQLTTEPFDLVLLDLVMPGINGYETCRQIRAHPATALLPIVMVTSLDPRRERVAGIEAGADDFLSRPFSPPELLARVRSLLRIKALQDRTTRQAQELSEWNARFEARIAEEAAKRDAGGQGGVQAATRQAAAGADAADTDAASLIPKLAALGVLRSLPRNMVVTSEGDAGDSLYVVLSGRVKLYVSDEEGHEMVLAEHGTGEIFGETDERPRPASVATIEPSQLAVVPTSTFRNFCIANPGVAMLYADRVMDRVRSLTQNVKSLALVDVYGRVAQLIMELAHDEEGCMVIDPRPTHQDIATRVGASREMISRILKDLVAGGYLRMEAGRMVVERRPPKAW
jgi:CRP/FNR family cyclic AMP-dependent transcriptional regulator